MSEVVYQLILFLIAVVIHEIGHITMFVYFTKKFPPIKFSIFGSIFLGSEEYSQNMTLRQYATTAIVGVVYGLIYLTITNAYISTINVYLLTSLYDIHIIMMIITIAKENKKYLNAKLKNVKMSVDV